MTTAARTLGRRVEPRRGLQWVGLLGGLAVVLASLAFQPEQAWSGLLVAAHFGVTLAMGGALFLAIQAVSGASWWLPIREVPLRLARTLPAPALALAACLWLGLESLYPWARPGALEANPLLASKAAWLNAPFFLLRAALVLGVWFAAIGWLGGRLSAWQAAPSDARARSLAHAAAGFLALFAATLSIAAWDWTMSLEPLWYSTIYNVYVFAGTLLGGIAAVTLLSLSLDRARLLGRPLPPGCRHDLGKLLFAFATFWAYIWFCQYMLVWYANLPEETEHYATRLAGSWATLFYLNPVLNWVVPFVTLLSISAKRQAGTLGPVALVVLLGRFLDSFLLIAPATTAEPVFPMAAAAAAAAVLSGMGWLWLRRAPHPG